MPEDPVNTLPQWNALLLVARGCRFPVPPAPILEYESAVYNVNGYQVPIPPIPSGEPSTWLPPGMTAEHRCVRYRKITISQDFSSSYRYSDELINSSAKGKSASSITEERSQEKDKETGEIVLKRVVVSATSSFSNSSNSTRKPIYRDNSTSSGSAASTNGGPCKGKRKFSSSGIAFNSGEPYNVSGTEDWNVCPSMPGAGVNHTPAGYIFSAPASYLHVHKLNDDIGGHGSNVQTTTDKWVLTEPYNLPQEVGKLSFPGDVAGQQRYAELTCTRAVRIRFRIIVPSEWDGDYYKITWDVLWEPEGWDETIPDPKDASKRIPKPGRPKRTFLEKGKTQLWKGPGKGEQDDKSWELPWQEIGCPTERGRKRVVNIRVEGYINPYGDLPTPYGDAVTLPDPGA